MFRKIMLVTILSLSFSWAMSASKLQTISKDNLGCIKGLGIKRVDLIISFRRSHTITSLDELLEIKGIGKGVLKNIKEDREKKVCTNFNKSRAKKSKKKKKNIRAE